MLPRTERMTRTLFERVYATGRRYEVPFFILRYTPSPTFRAAVVVSKKVGKTAIIRNKIRRRYYHTLIRVRECGVCGMFIIIAKPASVDVSYATLQDWVIRAVEEITSTRFHNDRVSRVS